MKRTTELVIMRIIFVLLLLPLDVHFHVTVLAPEKIVQYCTVQKYYTVQNMGIIFVLLLLSLDVHFHVTFL